MISTITVSLDIVQRTIVYEELDSFKKKKHLMQIWPKMDNICAKIKDMNLISVVSKVNLFDSNFSKNNG